jgi:hypothetical protein
MLSLFLIMFFSGFGFELPITRSGFTANTNFSYAFNHYNGTDLIQEDSPAPVANPKVLTKINIGGIIIGAGLRKYF